ncbi:MAG: bifunctional glutamate N-acetyltransferase/amino-acid acetyltransferase ArgJ [Dehalococcoidia bacterium]|nr:bifunctional glutamate N-acetyltransferase/amino-acid acetyltransferase ArgJ [Dehalococcoidia bacterium]
MNSELIPGGTITNPRGFLAGVHFAGIKKTGHGVYDLGILYSEAPCSAAGVFTTNRIKAAPVLLSRQHLQDSRARAIAVNSGCANACTGEQGSADAAEIAAMTARKLGLNPEEVLVASTGVIGRLLPMERVRKGLGRIVLSREAGHDLARAITTTDTFTKEVAVKVNRQETLITVAGIAKGAGMIHPDLATLLCFVTTDALVDPAFLGEALRRAIRVSFNMITVDGDTSPNDSVIVLANGLAGNRLIQGRDALSRAFERALQDVCIHLARSIARDGEGATRLIQVTVDGAQSPGQARLGARTVAGSALVKAAVHGCDPNWGRIIAALGRSGIEFAESGVDLYLDNLCLMKSGCPQEFDPALARARLGEPEVAFRISLNLGRASGAAWGCDLSEEYVTINSEYTS